MRVRLLQAVPVVLAITVPFLAGSAHSAAGQAAPISQIWLRDCAVCHGADGRGTNRGPTLVGVGAASVDYWVSTGRMPLVAEPGRSPDGRDIQPLPGVQLFANPDVVPRRRSPAYAPDVIKGLVGYVVDLTGGGGQPVPSVDVADADRPQGGEVFRLQCAACHAWAGDGGALLHREAPALHLATPTQIAEAVRIGPGAMPAFGQAALDDRQLSDLVSYVRYLDNPSDRGGWSLWHLGPVAEGGAAWLLAMAALLVAIRWMGDRE
jgi:ubiquinol-cytochrome c reductase cytochrome c subunit